MLPQEAAGPDPSDKMLASPSGLAPPISSSGAKQSELSFTLDTNVSPIKASKIKELVHPHYFKPFSLVVICYTGRENWMASPAFWSLSDGVEQRLLSKQ